MTFKSISTLVGACGLATVLSVGAAQANTVDDRAMFAFSSPVAIPGATLPAGDYIFRLADPDGGRSIVQVLDRDGNVYGMFFTQRVDRAMPADTAEVTLGEAPAGEAPSISGWWQPGQISGRVFMYRPGDASWDRDVDASRVGD